MINDANKFSALAIRKLQSAREIDLCAQAMASSEPWLTLGRSYEASVRIMQDPAREGYVAYATNELVGFLLLDMHGPFRGYIQTVCIMPEFRGNGAGRQLITFAEERIFREAPNVFMCVSSFNHAAHKLYERLGYKQIGVLKNYIVSGHDEILLRKTVAPWSEFEPKKAD